MNLWSMWFVGFMQLFYLATWQPAPVKKVQPISNPTHLAKSYSMLSCNPSTQSPGAGEYLMKTMFELLLPGNLGNNNIS